MTESEVLAGFEEYLGYLENVGKLMYLRLNSGMAFVGDKKKYAVRLCPTGTADILVVTRPHGHCIFIEAKDEDGVQSDKQKEFEQKVKAVGAEYYVCRTLDELMEVVPQGGTV